MTPMPPTLRGIMAGLWLSGLIAHQPVQPPPRPDPYPAASTEPYPVIVQPIVYPNGMPKVGDRVHVAYVGLSWIGGPRKLTETQPTPKGYESEDLGWFVWLDNDHMTIATTRGTSDAEPAFYDLRNIPRPDIRRVILLDIKYPPAATAAPVPGPIGPAAQPGTAKP